MAGKLHMPVRPPGVRDVAKRVGFMLTLLTASVIIVYFEGGLVDTRRGGVHPDFASSVYYAIITITTVGYGDIVPDTNRARIIDALLLTPIRFIFIFMFFGTAYQLVIQRLQEGYRMNRMAENSTTTSSSAATARPAGRRSQSCCCKERRRNKSSCWIRRNVRLKPIRIRMSDTLAATPRKKPSCDRWRSIAQRM
jgi:hypothetical protein